MSSADVVKLARLVCSKHIPEDELRAALAFGPGAFGYGGPEAELFVLSVADGLGPRARFAEEHVGGRRVSLIAVDRKLFRGDVARGLLGEMLADKLLLPYVPVEGADYLAKIEISLKKRLALELLMDVANRFPTMAQEILLDARYFLYEVIYRMGRIMPMAAYPFANLLARPADRRLHEPRMLKGFLRGLRELEAEGLVARANGFFRATGKLVRKAKRQRLLGMFLRLKGPIRGLSKYAVRALSDMAKPYVSERRAFLERFGPRAGANPLSALPRPDDFLLLRTSIGVRPALREVAFEEIARLIGRLEGPDDVELREIGGTVNLVYLVTVRSTSGAARLIVKYFKDWHTLKWLSLRLWALGAKRFAISGTERLKREYTMCRELGELGFPVPRIFHVDLRARCLVEEFIEGVNFSELLRRSFLGEENPGRVARLAREAGRLLARIHKVGIGVGDYKPENLIVGYNGRLNLVDLEQAARGGDEAWDVAEFLYYSGHYVPSVSTADVFEQVAGAFLEGYLDAGGSPEAIRKAPSIKFARVFSVFTPPQVIEAINELCGRF